MKSRRKGTTIPRNRLYIICGGFYHIFRKLILTTTPSISDGVIDNGTMCLLQQSASKELYPLVCRLNFSIAPVTAAYSFGFTEPPSPPPGVSQSVRGLQHGEGVQYVVGTADLCHNLLFFVIQYEKLSFPHLIVASLAAERHHSALQVAPLAAERHVPCLQVAPLTAERLVPVLQVAPLTAERHNDAPPEGERERRAASDCRGFRAALRGLSLASQSVRHLVSSHTQVPP